MWWMLKNHNPSGFGGPINNLQDWNFERFARYLAEVADHFKTHFDIEFTSVEPFNEPASWWWQPLGTQEGCYFDASLQAWIVGHLAQELAARPRLQRLEITASDENEYSEALKTWKTFSHAKTPQKANAQALVKKVNVHGYQYNSNDRQNLYDAVGTKTLWNSEYADGTGSGLDMATNMTLDFKWLHPTAWCYWQLVDETDGWGLLQGNLRAAQPTLERVEMKYFALAHFSRHIQPGMLILACGDCAT